MRYYSSSAGAMTLTSDITAGTTIIGVSTVTGLPTSFPYTIVLDVGQAAEEICTVTSSSGAALTVTRGQDGTSAQAHSLGAAVRHMMTARDLREPQDHIAATTAVHGVTGALAGVTDVQTLTNKTLNAPILTGATTAQQTTFQSSADGTVPVTVTGRFSQSANLQEWKNGQSLGVVAKVTPSGRFSGTATNLVIEGDAANTPAVTIPQEINGGRTVPQVDIDTRTDDTADILSLKKNGVQVAKFDKDGNLTVPTLSATTVSGTDISGSTVSALIRPRQYANAAARDAAIPSPQNGDLVYLTAPGGLQANACLTYYQGTAGLGGTWVDLDVPTNIPGTSAAKDKKRIHWGTYSTGALTGGVATITHSAGFTPTAVVITPQNAGLQFKAYNFTATTFDVQVVNSDGSASSTPLTISAFLGE